MHPGLVTTVPAPEILAHRVMAGRPPWIALALAVTFGGYGLLRKIAVFGEPFSAARLIGFAGIWLALLIYSLDGWRRATRLTAAAA